MALGYTEEIRQVQIYDYLVYVCGVEISGYTKSIEVVHTNRSGPGSATITLANPFDQWIVTTKNLAGGFRMAQDKYSEAPKYHIYYKKKALSAKLKIVPQANQVRGQKTTTQGDDLKQDAASTTETDLKKIAPSEDFLQRYSFGPGSCIFSKMDTVKIYVRNPYDEVSSSDQWIPFFTGTVDAKPFVTNFLTGESTVTLNCFDVRSAMQGMRISVNPYTNNILSANSTPTSGTSTQTKGSSTSGAGPLTFNSTDAGFFNDFFPANGQQGINTAYDNIFAGKTFVDAISMVIIGRTGWVSEGGSGKEEGTGIGSFRQGQVYRYTNPAAAGALQATKNGTKVGVLEGWDSLCMFGPKGRYWSYSECQADGANSFYDGTAHPFTGQLHWLLPTDKLPISSMFESTLEGAGDYASSPDWTDRYSLLTQMCQHVDYEFTVTGCGDIVFEFPMYDFGPTNFGEHASAYTTERHVTSDSISDEGGEVLAGLEAVSLSSNLGDRQAQGSLNDTPIQTQVPNMRVIVFNNVLASKYGARVQNASFTGVQTQEALTKLALIEFSKRLAEANKLSLNMVFRPYIRPNRPFLYNERNRLRLGKTTTVSYSMPVLQEPTMNMGLGCVRMPLATTTASDVYNNTVNFQHITGAAAMPLSFNEIFEQPVTFESNNAVTAKTVNTPDTPGAGGPKSSGSTGGS